MADLKTVEAEAKAVAAETTSVLSSLLGTWNPRWPRFVETWRGWSLRKRIEAGVVVVLLSGFVWYFGLSVMRLGIGGYRSAYAYGHGDYVTRTEVKAVKDNIMATLASVPTQAQFSDLEAKVNELEAKVQAADKPAQITTGSIAKKRRAAPVKSSASSWFSIP
jgi:hypothetical protein